MYYINTDTATEDHEFTDGDDQSIPATDLNADWFNMVQKELLNILTITGDAPNENRFDQIKSVLNKIGIRCFLSSDNSVNLSGFLGSAVIFHNATNFSINAINTNCLLVIVPLWRDDSAEYINVTYNGEVHKISKWRVFFGFSSNLPGHLLTGVSLAVMHGNDGNDIDAGDVKAVSVRALNRYEVNLVSFEYSPEDVDEETGLADWQTWQLAENWSVGQVKRVYCSNATDTGILIPVYYDANSSSMFVRFYPNAYREFMCVGTHVFDEFTFAALISNGK